MSATVELLNLWLFAQAIAKESVITGIAPVALFEILHGMIVKRRKSAKCEDERIVPFAGAMSEAA